MACARAERQREHGVLDPVDLVRREAEGGRDGIGGGGLVALAGEG